MSFEDLYQEIILDHYRAPKNRAPVLEGESVHVHHSNPLCGDELDLRVRIEDGRIVALAFDGEGCSISQSSASTMTQAMEGRALDDALDLSDDFRAMMRGEEPRRPDDLLDGIAFTGVAKFPVRVKCALLSWMAVRDAVETYREGADEHHVTIEE
jgi:nitrogen fixation NifU-like protein